MISVHARLALIMRKYLSGIGGNQRLYDDNIIHMALKVNSGPKIWLDRTIHCNVGISDFASKLPTEVAANLREELNERFAKLGA